MADDSSGLSEQSIEGQVKNIIFRDEASGFTVAALWGEKLETRVTGNFAVLRPSASYVFCGRWTSHPKYGRQFAAESAEELIPTEQAGVAAYLASGLIPGIGERMAQRIVDHFGPDTLAIIDQEPARLTEVPGIGTKTAAKITRALGENKDVERLMVFLRHHGVSTGLALKIHRHWGPEAIARLRDNPYSLTEDLFGVGFLTADNLAQKLGLRRHARERLMAAALYALDQAAARSGHCYLPADQLVAATLKLLNSPDDDEPVEPDELDQAVGHLEEAGKIMVEEDGLWSPYLYHAERGTARELLRLLDRQQPIGSGRLETAVAEAERSLGLKFAPSQKEAIEQALRSGVTVITGGPGTGKSTIVSGLLRVLSKLEPKARVSLAAPTGRAAQRLMDLTGTQANTIHRLLGYTVAEGEPAFTYHRTNQLPVDLLVVDEFSMVDVVLAYQLLQAIPTEARLIIVGDKDQLPSVGPGNVLSDLIASGQIPTVRLTQIFRQAQSSLITVNAHRINQGQRLKLETPSDFYFQMSEDPADTTEQVVETAVRMAGTFGMDNVQVLSPMHRHITGVQNLNRSLQERFNPPAAGKREYRVGDTVYRLGDKVMAVRNNYEKGVFNGNLGRLIDIVLTGEDEDVDEDTILVNFDGLFVPYTRSELDELVLAYAVTVHKAQGSEFACCIMVLSTQHWYMLQRNLLYTAITRGKEMVLLAGSRRALSRAIANNKVQERYTGLAERLQE